MSIKHSVMVGMMGRIADRFHEYYPAKSLKERLEDVQQMDFVDGIEIVYPSEFSDYNNAIRLIKGSGLAISAVNLNLKSEKQWEQGSFTSPDPSIRQQAIEALKTAMDLAAELGAGMVSCCPLIDGHNYNFEVNYLDQWQWLSEGIKQAASHRADVKVSLEYKLNECRNFNILGDMGRCLYLCDLIGLPNVGVTMDVGHALIARETPAEVMCLASQASRLFYIHFNDNDRFWDWDMIPGSVNFWDQLEVLYYIEKLNWEGWFSYDIVVRDGNVPETMQAGIENVLNSQKFLHKVGMQEIDKWLNEKSSSEVFKALIEKML